MKTLLLSITLFSSFSAYAASQKSPAVKMDFEKRASMQSLSKPFQIKDHAFNASLAERLNSSKDLIHKPKPSKIEEKALKLLSFGFEF